jgi:AraC-like DNA-binding protein
MAQRGRKRHVRPPRLARALAAIHREPDRSWQVDSLAAEAGMSRSAFSLLFTELVGQPPMHYVGEWRVRRAEALLHDRRNSVYAIAAQFGYRTEAAFRRAFKRFTGRGPGEVRRVT